MQPDSQFPLRMLNLLGDSIRAGLPAVADEQVALRALTADLSETFVQVCKVLAPGVILEIGAHEAEYARRMKAQLPAARVVAFEANPDVHRKYARDCLAGGVEYINRCVADQPGTLQFHVPINTVQNRPLNRMGSMLADLQVQGRKGSFAEFEVAAVTADGFLGRDSGTPNVIWVDVEGAIGAVLDGADATLRNCMAFYAEIESNERWQGQRLDRDVARQLAGYGLYPVLRDLQRTWQYNALFLSEAAIADPRVWALCQRYVRSTAEVAAAARPRTPLRAAAGAA